MVGERADWDFRTGADHGGSQPLLIFFFFFRILGIYYFTLFGGEKVGDISAISKSGNLNL